MYNVVTFTLHGANELVGLVKTDENSNGMKLATETQYDSTFSMD